MTADACGLCGGPLSKGARYGVCRRNPECRRVNDSRANRAHRRNKGFTPAPCTGCGADWIRRRGFGANDKLCPACCRSRFWCSGAPGGEAHVAEKPLRAGPGTCRSCRLLRHAADRARRLGIPFTVTWKYVESIYGETCPYLGIRLEPGIGTQHAASPTLDRIDPAAGYAEGNVEVISYLANAMKHNATPAQLLSFAHAVIGRYGCGVTP